MRILGIAFSARKEGNCLSCIKYCLDKFGEKGYEIELLNVYDFEIKPCSRCQYECFNKNPSCPIDDDIPKIYKKLEEANIVLFGVPNYGGHISGLYRAFSERMQVLNAEQIERDFLSKPKGFIIIGNLSAGGDMVLHEVMCDFHNLKIWPEAVLLSAREYGRNSLKGDLLESLDVTRRLDRLVEMLSKHVKE